MHISMFKILSSLVSIRLCTCLHYDSVRTYSFKFQRTTRVGHQIHLHPELSMLQGSYIEMNFIADVDYYIMLHLRQQFYLKLLS